MKFGRKHFLREEAGTMAGGAGGSSTGEAGTAHVNQNTNQASGTQGGGESGTQNQQNTGSEGDQGSGTFDINSLPKEAQKIISDLRAENAKSRTDKNNLSTRMEKFENGFKAMFGEGEGDNLTPEQQIESLSQNYQNAQFENAVIGIAYQNEVPHDKLEYFQFLMNKEVNGLAEGQELPEDALAEIIQKVKGVAGASASNSSVSENNNAGGDPDTGNAGTTLESFVQMSLSEKGELYRKNPNLYNSFMTQARAKRLL